MTKRVVWFLAFAAYVAFFAHDGKAQTATHSVTVTWTWAQTGGDPVTAWKVERGTAPGGPYVLWTTLTDPAARSYVDTAVSAGQTLYYVIVPTNSGGDSVPSPETSSTVPFSPSQGTITVTSKAK